MAGADGLGIRSGSGELAALLFMTASMNTLDAYSTLNSSPWTAESFGADERRARALREYVAHAVVYSLAYATAAAFISKNKGGAWAIMLGAVATNVYLVALYARASVRGRAAGSAGWASG